MSKKLKQKSPAPVEAPAQEEQEVPEELKQLQMALSDLAQYRNAVTLGSFPGGQAEAVHKMRNFLKETYDQVFKQFNDHPYVIEMKAKEAKQV